jgi:aspartyl-tRNA(Asn)/glutamyl-tRNA(Gln) amidotransferase subunit A
MFELTAKKALARARERQPVINAFISERFDAAESEANAVKPGPLSGVPYGLKDEWETTCLPTTGGSHRHIGRIPPADASVHEVFRDAGGILLGKTNMSDFGVAPESVNWVAGATRNPFDHARTSGGSSGGAAAAVSDGQVAFDWGTDIGGSIRLPAAYCGVLGLKLSSETWPLSGSFPIIPKPVEWMCGQGPLTRTTQQMRAVLEVAAPKIRVGQARSWSPTVAAIYAPSHTGLWPTFAMDVAPHLKRAFNATALLAPALPPTDKTFLTYGGVWASSLEKLLEADESITLAQGIAGALSGALLRGRLLKDRRFYPNTAELLTAMAFGRLALFRDADKARGDAMRVKEAFEALWSQGVVIAAPVTSYPPPIIGKSNRNRHLLESTAPGNMADATGLSIPFGTFSPDVTGAKDRLPRSLQLLGPPGSEQVLLDIADRLIASRDTDPMARPIALPL